MPAHGVKNGTFGPHTGTLIRPRDTVCSAVKDVGSADGKTETTAGVAVVRQETSSFAPGVESLSLLL